jgi:hypothetical protein
MGRTTFSGPLAVGSYETNIQLAHDGSGRGNFSKPITGGYIVVPLYVPGTLAVGDGAAKWIAPFDCRLVHVGAWVKNTGGTSGNTSIQVSVGATDYLTSNLLIAYNDTDGVAETEALANQDISKGSIVEVDIDAVPGTASADLTVYLTLYVKGHSTNV